MDRTTRSQSQARRGLRPRDAGLALAWLLAWLLAVVVGVEFLLSVYGKYGHVHSQAYAMFAERRGWLWLHLGGGAMALALGATQFLSGWRRAWPRTHRWLGRGCMVATLLASAGAAGLIATSAAPLSIRIAFAATALAWLTSALFGLRAIRRGAIEAHRHWMTRYYLVTLAPVIFRGMLDAAIGAGLVPAPATIATLLWLSWVLPLLGYQVLRGVFAGRRVEMAAGARAVAPPG